MAEAKTKSAAGTYRYVGDHAIILESGAPLGIGEYVTLTEISPAAQELIDEGKLLDASGVEVPSEASTTPDNSSTTGRKTSEGSGE